MSIVSGEANFCCGPAPELQRGLMFVQRSQALTDHKRSPAARASSICDVPPGSLPRHHVQAADFVHLRHSNPPRLQSVPGYAKGHSCLHTSVEQGRRAAWWRPCGYRPGMWATSRDARRGIAQARKLSWWRSKGFGKRTRAAPARVVRMPVFSLCEKLFQAGVLSCPGSGPGSS